MGTDLEKKVDQLTVDNATNVTRITTLESWIKTLQSDITEIKDVLINRPTWQMTGIVTFLSSVCVALLTIILTAKIGH